MSWEPGDLNPTVTWYLLRLECEAEWDMLEKPSTFRARPGSEPRSGFYTYPKGTTLASLGGLSMALLGVYVHVCVNWAHGGGDF